MKSKNARLSSPSGPEGAPDPAEVRRQVLAYLARWDLRWRLTRLTVWIPRGLAVGLVVGLAASLYSRARPWLMPEQVLAFSILAAILGALVAVLGVWLWPRPVMRAARYFDQVFDLQERSSTALEIAEGSLDAPPSLAAQQAQDALDQAARVVPRRHLHFGWRRGELALVAVLIAALVFGLLLANPQVEALAQQAALEEAMVAQAEALEEILRQIEAESDLTPDQKAQLSQIVEGALQRLQQEDVSPPEAVAELTQATQELGALGQQMSEEQRRALSGAGDALNESAMTQGAAQALREGNLAEAAGELQQLARQAGGGQMTTQQAAETASALEAAADALEQTNPEAAEALRRAAQALRNGDNEEAQRALQEAAEKLQDQQQAMQNSAFAQMSRDMAMDMSQASRQLAQAGQPSQQQRDDAPPGEFPPNAPQDYQLEQSENAAPRDPSQASSGEGQPSGQESDQLGGQGSAPGDGRQLNAPSEGDSLAVGGQGEDQGGMPLPGRASSSSGGSDEGDSQGQASASQGIGSGESGRDVLGGDPTEQEGDIRYNNQRGEGGLASNQFIYAPSFVGGDGGAMVHLNSDAEPNSTDTVEQVESISPEGVSDLSFSELMGMAASQAGEAMDMSRVPGALRGVIREYFTGLQK
ncbi:MAG: hypothetical protein IT323_19180 [Anaerolineae bacterium]|nr:hypothetical protein [Anaerolineae bacterium]